MLTRWKKQRLLETIQTNIPMHHYQALNAKYSQKNVSIPESVPVTEILSTIM